MAGGYSGALWYRVPQARFSYSLNKKTNFALAVTRPQRDNAIGITKKEGVASGQPGLEAKMSTKIGGAKFVLSGALGAWENDAGGTTADVELLALGYSFPVMDVCTISGQAWTGQNLKDFLGSPGMGYEDNAVEAKGGFIDVSAPVTPGITLSAGHGISDPDEEASTEETFDKNSTSYATVGFKLFEKISTKVTYAKNKTDNFGGSDLENSHFQTSFTYVF